MKTIIRLSIYILLLSLYACSQEDDYFTPNKLSSTEELKLLALENGYTDFKINISTPLTQEEVYLCKCWIKKKIRTRGGRIQNYMHIAKISEGILQFDYSRDTDTKEIIEAYGGVYGNKDDAGSYPDRYFDVYSSIQTLSSRPEFMNNSRFDLIIKANKLTSRGGSYSSSSAYDRHCYRLTIAAGLNVDTQTHNITFYEQGEGEWPQEP